MATRLVHMGVPAAPGHRSGWQRPGTAAYIMWADSSRMGAWDLLDFLRHDVGLRHVVVDLAAAARNPAVYLPPGLVVGAHGTFHLNVRSRAAAGVFAVHTFINRVSPRVLVRLQLTVALTLI